MKYKQPTKDILDLQIFYTLFKRLTFSMLVVFSLNIYPLMVLAEEIPEIVSENQSEQEILNNIVSEDALILDNENTVSEDILDIDLDIKTESQNDVNNEKELSPNEDGLETTNQQENSEQGDGKNQIVSKNSNNNQIPKVQNFTGAMLYSYDIQIPKGRRNIEPNISISYNSQQISDLTNIVGYGWEFDIPYIERVNKIGTDSLYVNNYFSSSLSGELKEVYTGLYSPKVENGDFNKYEYDGVFWIVKDKMGTVYKYGELSNGRLDDSLGQKTNKWMLTEIRDQYDNFVRYEYFKNEGQIYPYKIYYTGNGATDGIFEIEFTRESRLDMLSFYNYAFLVKNNYRINGIKIKKENILLKEYILSYIVGDNSKRSLLYSISEVGYKNNQTTTKPSTIFNYQTTTPGWTLDDTTWTAPFAFGNGHEQMLDVNGDGLQDITKSVKTNLYPPNPNYPDLNSVWIRNSNSKTWSLDNNYQLPIYFLENEIRGGVYQNYWEQGVRFVDVNGDLLPDIIKAEENTLTSYDSSTPPFSRGGFDAYLNTGSGWVQDLSKSPTVPIQSDNNVYIWGGVVNDMNGDGLAEVFTKINVGVSNDRYQKNNGQGFDSETLSGIPTDNSKMPSVRFVEINGDGLPDIIYSYHNNQWQQYYYNTYINKGDNTWILDNAYNTPFNTLNNSGTENGLLFFDVNNDGLTDVLPNYNLQYTNSDYKTYLNTGAGWVAKPTWNIPQEVESDALLEGSIHIVDLDNNGSLDFIRTINQMQFYTKVHINNNTKKADLLSKITLSSKGFSEIEYKKSSDLRDSSGNLLNPNLPLVVDVVSKITSNDNNGIISQNVYKYEGGFYYFNSSLDRKFAGFNIITETDINGDVIKSYYHQGNSTNSSLGEYNDTSYKIGKLYRQEKYNNSGIILEKTINSWDEYNLATDVSFVKLNTSIEYIHHQNQINQKSSAVLYNYDNLNGNLLGKEDLGEVIALNDGTFTDIGNDKIVYIYEYANNLSSTARLDSYVKDVIKKDYQNTKFNETKYYYDNQSFGDVLLGNTTKESKWIDGTQYQDSENTYDIFGLVLTTKDSLSNQTSYIYDTYNLYPVTITNPLSQSLNYEYDYFIGKPSKIIDSNSQNVYYDYDGLGRIISERGGDNSNANNYVVKKQYSYDDYSIPNSITITTNINNSLNNTTKNFFDGFGK